MIPKNITINFFCHVYLPQTGGIERYTANFSDELVKLGYKVNIISTDSHGLGNIDLHNGKIIYRLNSLNVLDGRFPFPYSAFQIYQVYKHFFSGQETLVILNSRLFLTSLIGLILGKISGSQIILIEHGSSHISYSSRLLAKAFAFYEHLISYVYKLSKIEFYGVSKACNKWLEHFGIKANGIINNGINPEFEQYENILENLGLDKTKKTITFVGRLIYEKGVIELIEAFNKFETQYPEYQLAIVGEGDLDSKVKFLAFKNKNIHYIGKISHDKVMNLLENTALFVNPSSYAEGLPTTILEAGYLGAPVISTPNGGAKEVITEKTGQLIASASIENILNSLTEFHLFQDEYILKNLKLIELIGKNYIWKKIAGKFVENTNLVENQKLYLNLDFK